MKNQIIVFIIIVAIIGGVFGFLNWQNNLYSKETLKLEILGTRATVMGEEIEYIVKYKNNGDIRLEDARLVFEYPEYSVPIKDKSLRITKELSDIYPGQEQTFRLKARLFGKKGEAKEAKASLSYRPKNLEARFESKTTFTTLIESVPITFEFDILSRAESGREIKFFLNYFSKVDYPLSQLGIKTEYPSGFQFLESSPSALEESNWEFSSLNKTEGGRIEIKGILTGGVKEQKVFRAKLGLWQEGEFVILNETSKGVEIIEPSLRLSQFINGSSRYNANIGDLLHYEIYFQNIGDEPFEHLSLVARLESELFDFQTIRSDFGECAPGDKSVIWDWREVPELRFLDAGEEGKVELWIKLKEEWPYQGQGSAELSLKNKLTVLGQTREEFITKVNSELELVQQGYIDDEIFGSEGPLPPKAGETSLFTIIWKVKNSYNPVENVKVKAVLPSEVELTGKILPEEASFTFDSESRELVWAITQLEPGQGAQEPFQLAFQVALTPTSSQKGKSAVLVSEARILGEDKWAEEILEVTAEAVDTTLGGTVSDEQGRVK